MEEGEKLDALCILAQGLAIGSRKLSDGQQQNLALYVPGDTLNVDETVLGDCDVSVCGLTAVSVVSIPMAGLKTSMERQPELARLLWRETAFRSRLAREWLLALGRRSAVQRLAHLLCETYARLEALGQADGGACHLPLTQSELADTLGLSPVHVNRVLQQLRADELVELAHQRLLIRDWAGLASLSEFDPGYLDLPRKAVGGPCQSSTLISAVPTAWNGMAMD